MATGIGMRIDCPNCELKQSIGTIYPPYNRRLLACPKCDSNYKFVKQEGRLRLIKLK
ncbi:hypothetical protein KKC56_03505 [Patescibacteria group bacterium]|nr:hypothetical protein [Patescibacteria group bacterium]